MRHATRAGLALMLGCAVLAVQAVAGQSNDRPRARDLGLRPGVYEAGPHNAITDVDGVRVGHVTIVEGDAIRTGVTAILPHGGNLFRDKVVGAVFVGNAFGKLAGALQVRELGTIETPIVLTNTLNVAAGIAGVVDWTLAQPGNDDVRSVNAVVGETNDGGLNDIRARRVSSGDVRAAIEAATSGPVAEGSVGAGTGTRAFGWKGGIGTSSRRFPSARGGYTVGVLVQSNYGGELTMGGAPVGRALAAAGAASRGPSRSAMAEADGDGSCMIVVATDAPLDARDLERLAARALFGLGRTGASYSNGSGDFAIAFTTSRGMPVPDGTSGLVSRSVLSTEAVSPLFQAALEATEEAVYNSLLRATTITSRIGTAEAIPVERVREILRHHRVLP